MEIIARLVITVVLVCRSAYEAAGVALARAPPLSDTQNDLLRSLGASVPAPAPPKASGTKAASVGTKSASTQPAAATKQLRTPTRKSGLQPEDITNRTGKIPKPPAQASNSTAAAGLAPTAPPPRAKKTASAPSTSSSMDDLLRAIHPRAAPKNSPVARNTTSGKKLPVTAARAVPAKAPEIVKNTSAGKLPHPAAEKAPETAVRSGSTDEVSRSRSASSKPANASGNILKVASNATVSRGTKADGVTEEKEEQEKEEDEEQDTSGNTTALATNSSLKARLADAMRRTTNRTSYNNQRLQRAQREANEITAKYLADSPDRKRQRRASEARREILERRKRKAADDSAERARAAADEAARNAKVKADEAAFRKSQAEEKERAHRAALKKVEELERLKKQKDDAEKRRIQEEKRRAEELANATHQRIETAAREARIKAGQRQADAEAEKEAQKEKERQEWVKKAKKQAEEEEKAKAEVKAKAKAKADAESKAKSEARAKASGESKASKRDEQEEMVVNFLYLVNDGLPHADLWKSFFDGAPAKEFRMFIHCRDRHACRNSNLLTALPRMSIVQTVPSYYCHDLVSSMVQLLKESMVGLKPDQKAKFVFISDSTLPLKPAPEVFAALNQNDESDICVLPSHHWGKTTVGTKVSYLVKHSQWVVLNHEHAQKMVREWQPVDSGGHWSVPVQNNAVWSTLDVSSFGRNSVANYCTDEWAFWAKLWGAVPDVNPGETTVPVQGWSGHNLAMRGPGINTVQGKCHTFAYWDDWGPEFHNLAAAIAKDYPRSHLSCYPNCGLHPMAFLRVSNTALLALRKSPFLFGRKFTSDLQMPEFKNIVLAKDAPLTVTEPASKWVAHSSHNAYPTPYHQGPDLASNDFVNDVNPPELEKKSHQPTMARPPPEDAKVKDNSASKTWWGWMLR